MKCLLIASLILLVYSCDSKPFKKAWTDVNTPDHSHLHYMVSQGLMDTAYIGLRRFYNDKGHYPTMEGKYFFDSIKTYVGRMKTYVFSDSWQVASKPFGVDNYLDVDSCFLSIGDDMPIIYRYRKNSTFLLYSVGENEIDERGTGDDIVYKKDR